MTIEAVETPETKPEASETKQNNGAIEELKAQVAAAKSEADGLKAKDKKAKAVAAKADAEAAAAKAVADGKASETIKDLQSQLANVNTEIETFRENESKRVDALLEKLPEAARASLSGFRDKLPLADFSKLLENQISMLATSEAGSESQGDDVTDKRPAAMPAPSPAARQVKVRQGRELPTEAKVLLDEFGVPHKAGEQLENNDGKIGMGLRQFCDALNSSRVEPVRLDQETELRRRG